MKGVLRDSKTDAPIGGAHLELMADTGVDCIEPLDPLGGVDVADAYSTTSTATMW